MKKIQLLIALISIAILSFNFPGESKETIFRKINEEVLKNGQGYDLLKEATSTIGHRLTGSDNGEKAEEFTYKAFQAFGFDDVQYFSFEVEAWSRDSVRLQITENEKTRNIPAVTLAHSPVSAEVGGTLVDAGNGLKKDFEAIKDQVKDKIALINIGIYPKDSTLKNLHRSEKMALAIQYGALGAIFVNTVEGNILLTGTASVDGSSLPVPGVCISLEEGKTIREQLKKGRVTAQLWMKNKSAKIKARDVIATIRGSELPDEEILIGGHLDSWDLSTGAIDNGIGSFSILEIARTFKKLNLRPKRTIRFIMFMGEEQGLLGSKAYVKKRVEDKSINKVRYLINLDMAGNTTGFNGMGRTEMESFLKETGKQIAAVDTAFKNKITNSLGGLHSDHQPFILEGIPALGTHSSLDPGVYKFYHSNKDDFSLVNRDHMNTCSRFVGMMLYALADAKEIPAKRQTSEEIKSYLEKFNLKEELILAKEWRWGE